MDTQAQDTKISVQAFRKKNALWILAIIIIAISCGLIGYYIGLNVQAKKTLVEAKKNYEPAVTVLPHRLPTQSNTGIGALPQDPAVTLSPATGISRWKRFSDSEGFTLEYPADWTMNADSSLENNPKNEITSVTFVIDANVPNKGPLIAQINVNLNGDDIAPTGQPTPTSTPRNTILAQEVQSLQQDNIVSGNPTPVVIDGYPAVEFRNNPYDYLAYYAIAPGIARNDAEYSFQMDSTQSDYAQNDPFLQQQLQNFSKVVLSTKFPQE